MNDEMKRAFATQMDRERITSDYVNHVIKKRKDEGAAPFTLDEIREKYPIGDRILYVVIRSGPLVTIDRILQSQLSEFLDKHVYSDGSGPYGFPYFTPK
jgi:hypothetical protein